MDGVSFPLIVVRQVWKHNLLKEFDLIKIAGMTHRMAAFDTEFSWVWHSVTTKDHCSISVPSINTLGSLTLEILMSIMASRTQNQSSYSKARESISTRT